MGQAVKLNRLGTHGAQRYRLGLGDAASDAAALAAGADVSTSSMSDTTFGPTLSTEISGVGPSGIQLLTAGNITAGGAVIAQPVFDSSGNIIDYTNPGSAPSGATSGYAYNAAGQLVKVSGGTLNSSGLAPQVLSSAGMLASVSSWLGGSSVITGTPNSTVLFGGLAAVVLLSVLLQGGGGGGGKRRR